MRAGDIEGVAAPASVLVIYFTLISMIYLGRYADPDTALAPMYYLYNSLVFWLCASLCIQYPRTMRELISISCTIILLVQAVAVGLEYRLFVGSRATGTLNDPNQVSYLCILVLYAKMVSHRRLRGDLSTFVCVLLAAYVILEAQSRSATIGLGALVVVYLWFWRASLSGRLVITILLLFAAGFAAERGIQMYDLAGSGPVMELLDRFREQGRDDTFAGRGYRNLVEYPQYLVFGAGEGARGRFNFALEIHSTWANILFCYGMVGFLIFIWFLVRTFRGAPLFRTLLFIGPALYGITTYGARFTMFWVALALAYGFTEVERRQLRH